MRILPFGRVWWNATTTYAFRYIKNNAWLSWPDRNTCNSGRHLVRGRRWTPTQAISSSTPDSLNAIKPNNFRFWLILRTSTSIVYSRMVYCKLIFLAWRHRTIVFGPWDRSVVYSYHQVTTQCCLSSLRVMIFYNSDFSFVIKSSRSCSLLWRQSL